MSDLPLGTRGDLHDITLLKRKQEKNKLKPIIIVTLIVVLWGGLFYLGYWYTNHMNIKNWAYIDSRIEEEVNELRPKIDEVHMGLVEINEELLRINQELAITTDLLYGTDTNKLVLQQRIDELNLQLNELQASIERLRDAATN
ncbi:MAG: coiled-coil domain-containing protein [Vulcanibacillus sp.]